MEVIEKAKRLSNMVDLFKDLANDEITNGSVQPKIIALLDTGDVIGGPIPSEIIPDHMMTTVANQFFRQVNPQVAVFSSEAWLLKLDDKDIDMTKDIHEELDKYGGRVMNHPQKIEVVVIVGGFDGYTEFCAYRIIREEGMIPRLENEVFEKHENQNSVFAKCFEGVFSYQDDTIGETIGTA